MPTNEEIDALAAQLQADLESPFIKTGELHGHITQGLIEGLKGPATVANELAGSVAGSITGGMSGPLDTAIDLQTAIGTAVTLETDGVAELAAVAAAANPDQFKDDAEVADEEEPGPGQWFDAEIISFGELCDNISGGVILYGTERRKFHLQGGRQGSPVAFGFVDIPIEDGTFRSEKGYVPEASWEPENRNPPLWTVVYKGINPESGLQIVDAVWSGYGSAVVCEPVGCRICMSRHPIDEPCPEGTTEWFGSTPGATPEEPTTPSGFTAYYSSSKENCYTKKSGETKTAPDDIVIGTGSTRDAALAEGSDYCGPKSEIPISTEPITFGTSYHRCASNAYVAMSEGQFTFAEVNLDKIGDAVLPNIPVDEWTSATGGGVFNRTVGTAIVVIALASRTILNNLGVLAKKAVANLPCSTAISIAAITSRTILSWLRIIIGPAATEMDIPLRYTQNRECPNLFPTTTEATEAYLAGNLNDATFESWININGNCTEPWGHIVDARRARISPGDLAMALRRDFIDQDEYAREVRGQGFIHTDQAETIFKLTEALPGVQDIMRFMVRDVADESITFWEESDKIFKLKYDHQLKKFGEDQGIPEEFAKFAWRAHWVLPSPDQLAEMLHRNSRLPKGDPAYVDEEIVRSTLQQQDIHPYWIERFLSVSYRPLTRIDLRRAFDIGAIDRERVLEGYQQIGYDEDNAETLTKFAEDLKFRGLPGELPVRLWKSEVIDRQEAKKRLLADGFPDELVDNTLEDAAKLQRGNTAMKLFAKHEISITDARQRLQAHGIPAAVYNKWLEEVALGFDDHPVLKEYNAGLITEGQANEAMTRAGIPVARQNELIAEENAKINLDIIKRCARALRDRFMRGEINVAQAHGDLANLGMPPQRADAEVAAWRCELEAMGRDAPTSTLCRWLELGLINGNQFTDRLLTMGWSRDDAFRIVADCSAKLGAKRQREIDASAKKLQSQLDKDRRERERSEKQFNKSQKQREKAAETSARARRRREFTLIKAADKLRDKLGIGLPDAVQMVKEAKTRVQNELVLKVDTAIQAVKVAVDKYDPEDGISWNQRVDNVAEALVQAEKVSDQSVEESLSTT